MPDCIKVTLLMMLLINLGCNDTSVNREQSDGSDAPGIKSLITEEQAVEIARRAVSSEYDVSDYEVTVFDQNDFWGVQFTLPAEKKRSSGRGAVVEVYKSNGSIRSKYIGK
ncbi:MAG: PepSY domain-containing protein [Acidobacteriota bacterium]|nr:PepSY domain-containing protein [Acidobacteriota bacterium]